MTKKIFLASRTLILGLVLLLAGGVEAQFGGTQKVVNVDVNSLIQKATVSFSPRTGSFEEGSTFEISLLVNTEGKSINTIDLRLNFDPTKLMIVQPSGNRSIIALWLEPPSYSNSKGTMHLSGVVPGGITAESGLIATITFKALVAGSTRVSISSTSQILANDGFGSAVNAQFGSASYDIIPHPPEGVMVFSDTHPFQDKWYNNNTPVFSWEKPPGVGAFSYELDDKPTTIPDNNADTEGTTASFPDLKSGLFYFHLKASKGGFWGGTTHFLVRTDTTPPAEFTPKTEVLSAASGEKRAFASFFTTDALSGLDRYEVGVIDTADSPNISPVFVQAESPYQLPLSLSGETRVVVRAFDRAGNARDESVNLTESAPAAVFSGLKNWFNPLGIAMAIFVTFIILHYLFGHHLLRYLRVVWRQMREEEFREKSGLPKMEWNYHRPASPGVKSGRYVPRGENGRRAAAKESPVINEAEIETPEGQEIPEYEINQPSKEAYYYSPKEDSLSEDKEINQT